MNVAHRHAINNYESGMEPSLRKKKPELFFTLTTVNAELVFNAVIEKLKNVSASLKNGIL